MPPRRSKTTIANNELSLPLAPVQQLQSLPLPVKKTQEFKTRQFLHYPRVPHGFPMSVLRNAKRSTRESVCSPLNESEPVEYQRPMRMIGETSRAYDDTFDRSCGLFGHGMDGHPDFIVKTFIDRPNLKWGEDNRHAVWQEIFPRKPKAAPKKPKDSPKKPNQYTLTAPGKLLRTIAERKRNEAKRVAKESKKAGPQRKEDSPMRDEVKQAAEESKTPGPQRNEEDSLLCDEDLHDIIWEVRKNPAMTPQHEEEDRVEIILATPPK